MDTYDTRRQSVPKDTAKGFLSRMFGHRDTGERGDVNHYIVAPIGRKQVKDASEILLRYQGGKKALEDRIIKNEQWYKMRHWGTIKTDKNDEVKPVSGWLFNVIANKHADAMDNMPTPTILPREPGDAKEAKELSSIVPVVLDQTDFEQVYADVQLYKLKTGTGVYGVGWNGTLADGKGDIEIRKVDLLNLYWEPGITDIQDSANVFYVYLVDNDFLKSQYPELEGKLGGKGTTTVEYHHDDNVDNSNKSVVIDWYYKRKYGSKTVLHYVKYVNDHVLYATENQDGPEKTQGLYNHGRYPFVFDTLYTVEDSPAGFGFIDVGKSDQEYIDRGRQAIMKNMLAGAKPRFFVKSASGVNTEEFTDITKDIVHCSGSVNEDAIRAITTMPLPEIYVSVIDRTIEELKETTGNRDISSGGTTSGVTAASAIAAMQEAGAKLTRDSNKAAYRAFRKVILQVIELIRQFYDTPRKFRILGAGAEEADYITYQNTGLARVSVSDPITGEETFRTPIFDIKVGAEKASPYSRMAQNELAFELYGKGIFNPAMADQALMCLEMMDIDNKEEIMARIKENGDMYDENVRLKEEIDRLAGALGKMTGGNGNGPAPGDGSANPAPPMPSGADEGKSSFGEEPSTTAKARARVAQSTEVR